MNKKKNGDKSDEYAEIKQAIENKKISAITIDTTVFDDSGMRLDKGVFSQLKQFHRHPSSLVISEVVVNEIRKHLLKSISTKRDRFSKDMTEAADYLGYDSKAIDEIKIGLSKMLSPEAQCEKQLSSFLLNSAAINVEADDYINVSDILRCYFEKKPPFHAENPKKDEFPDAIALLSLEGWAEDYETEVVVVSRDDDWITFCANSSRLHHVRDLATALALFQSPDEAVRKMVDDLREELRDRTSQIFSQIEQEIKDAHWQEYITFSGDSQFQFCEDEPYVEINKCVFLDHEEGIVVTDIEEDAVSVVFAVEVEGEIVVNYEFQKWDGIDKEYIPMGSNEIHKEFITSVSILLQVPTRSADPDDLSWEVEPDALHFELGELEPDWMSERE